MADELEVIFTDEDVSVVIDDDDIIVVEVGVGLPGSQGEDGVVSLATTTVEAIWIGASAFNSETTNGAERATRSLSTTLQIIDVLKFNDATKIYANFYWKPPPRWNLGTLTFIPHWTAASGSGNFVIGLQAVAVGNGDALNAAYGTAINSTDTLISANALCIGPESAAITAAGTPTLGDGLWLRLVCDAASTLSVDAELLGIELFITTNSIDDSA